MSLLRFGAVLDGSNTSHCIEDLGHGCALAVADVLEIVGVLILVDGVGLRCIDAAVKILDFLPELSLCDGGVIDRSGGILQIAAIIEIVGQTLKIVLPLNASQIGCQTVPDQSAGIVDVHSLPVLIHPA